MSLMSRSGRLRESRIIDFTRQMAGPYATMALADYGADVIKVESKPDGDPSRRSGLRSWDEVSALFLTWNRTSEASVLTLRTTRGSLSSAS